MDAKQFKKLIKEAVREALQEELINMGKQKLQESFGGGEPWPTAKLTTNNISSIREDLAKSFSIPVVKPVSPEQGSNPYEDMLAQIAGDMKRNPGEAQNYR